MANSEVAAEPLEPDSLSWREQAVARSLDSARLRAETRVQRFLDAATELFNSGSGKDFTVQEVVDRSGQSLRSFYQYFGGKHELLLALFEESVRSTTEYLAEKVADEDDPLERLHRFVIEYHRLCRPTADRASGVKGRPPFMAEFAQQLLTEHPKEAARVFSPLVALFEEVLEGAAAVGAIRTGPRRGPIVGVVLEAIMFNSFSSTIGGAQEQGSAEDLWDLVFYGIGTGPAS
ncbi:MAG: TetR/AcrR family transcriptional regulator [Acidimicrobiales bacterium]